MPAIMAGVRLAIGRAVKGIVTAEMLLTLTGIGAMIMQYGSVVRHRLAVCGDSHDLNRRVIDDEAVQWLDRRLTGWKAEIGIE